MLSGSFSPQSFIEEVINGKLNLPELKLCNYCGKASLLML